MIEFESDMSPAQKRRLITLIVSVIVGIFAIITFCRSCTIIDATEEGALSSFGVVKEEVYGPGMHMISPIGQKMHIQDQTPIEYNKDIPLGEKALITKDGQSLGINFTLTWKYKPGTVVECTKKYSSKESLYALISGPCKQAFHNEIGKLEALEFVAQQQDVIDNVLTYVTTKVANLPIEVIALRVDNITWNKSFEAQIDKTMELKAQVEQANQDAAKAAAAAQKRVSEAKADADAAIEAARKKEAEATAEANANYIKAEKDAAAKKLEADALAYYNAKVAQNYQVEIKLKELEIEKIKAERWNGKEVSDQAVYVPNTYDLKKQ